MAHDVADLRRAEAEIDGHDHASEDAHPDERDDILGGVGTHDRDPGPVRHTQSIQGAGHAATAAREIGMRELTERGRTVWLVHDGNAVAVERTALEEVDQGQRNAHGLPRSVRRCSDTPIGSSGERGSRGGVSPSRSLVTYFHAIAHGSGKGQALRRPGGTRRDSRSERRSRTRHQCSHVGATVSSATPHVRPSMQRTLRVEGSSERSDRGWDQSRRRELGPPAARLPGIRPWTSRAPGGRAGVWQACAARQLSAAPCPCRPPR